MRIPLIAFLFLAMFVIWQIKQSQARRRLREIDAGKRCIACDGTDTEIRNDWVRCSRCLHTESLAKLRSAVVSDEAVEELTKPEDPRRWR